MLKLVTGLPRNGKTANVVDSLLFGENKDRLIFTNISFLPAGLEFNHNINLVTDEELKNWMQYPDGSLIVIDEVQNIFPTRSSNKPLPEGVNKIATHGHRAFDLIFITQHPRMIDAWIKSFVQIHEHFYRPFGFFYTYKYTKEGIISDPDKSLDNIGCVKTKHFLPKRIYPYYKSAVGHNVKFRPPKLLIACIVGIFLCSIWVIWSLNNGYQTFFNGGIANLGQQSKPSEVTLPGVNSGPVNNSQPVLSQKKSNLDKNENVRRFSEIVGFHPDCWKTGDSVIRGQKRKFVVCNNSIVELSDFAEEGYTETVTRLKIGNETLSPLPLPRVTVDKK